MLFTVCENSYLFHNVCNKLSYRCSYFEMTADLKKPKHLKKLHAMLHCT